MRVRCGACRTQFDVQGAGRYACPACGSVNAVRDGNGQGEPPAGSAVGGYAAAPGVAPPGGQVPPPPPRPEPEAPLPKIECPECGFTFIVGMVPTVTCPNCSTEVETGIEEDAVD